VELTPRDIQDKQFHDAFRGYSHEEVDAFLDEVALAFDTMYRQNQTLERRIAEIGHHGGHGPVSSDPGRELEMLRNTIDQAERTATDTVEEARTEASRLRSEAEADAAAVVGAAGTKARDAIADAEMRAGEIVARALATERELEARISELRKLEDRYRDRLTSFLESQLRVLVEAPLLQPAIDIAPVLVRGEPEPDSASAPETEDSREPDSREPGVDPITVSWPAEPVGSEPAVDLSSGDGDGDGPGSAGDVAALRVVTGPTRGRAGPAPAGSRPEPAGPPPGPTRRQDTRPTARSASDGVDEEEHRSITRLFWGGEE
jgi:cell division initiation protein